MVNPMKYEITEATASRGRYISYSELKKHSTYTDAWISINGIVYDICIYFTIGFASGKHIFNIKWIGATVSSN